jgi:hypothetical protein
MLKLEEYLPKSLLCDLYEDLSAGINLEQNTAHWWYYVSLLFIIVCKYSICERKKYKQFILNLSPSKFNLTLTLLLIKKFKTFL